MRDWRLACLLGGAVMVFVALGCTSKDWQQRSYDKAGFAVQMPCPPTTTSDFQNLGNNSALTITNYSCSPGALSGQLYTVIVGQYSNWSMGNVSFDMDLAIENARTSIQSQGGTIVSEGDVEMGGFDGYEFQTTKSDMSSRLRLVVDEENFKFYMLELAAKEGKFLEADAERFFGSFGLL